MLGSFCIVGILILSAKDISCTWLSFDCELKVLFLVSLSSLTLKCSGVQWCSSISVNIPELSKYSVVSTLHCFLHSYTQTDTLLLIRLQLCHQICYLEYLWCRLRERLRWRYRSGVSYILIFKL